MHLFRAVTYLDALYAGSWRVPDCVEVLATKIVGWQAFCLSILAIRRFGDTIMPFSYSTDSLDSSDTFEGWKDAVCGHLISADASAVDGGSYSGAFRYDNVSGLDISYLTCMKHRWERTHQCLKRFPEDDYWLAYMERGSAQIEQNGNTTTIIDGQFVVYDAASVYTYSMESEGMHIVRLPRKLIEKRIPLIQKLAGRTLDNRCQGISALKAMILEVSQKIMGENETYLNEAYADVFFEVFSLCANQQVMAEKDDRQAALYLKALHYIRENLADSQLSLNNIAEAMHVSTRTLTRVFAAHGQSPMSLVWSERLSSAKRMLCDSKCQSVTQVALDNGFTDISHFSQSFRKTFGLRPSLVMSIPFNH